MSVDAFGEIAVLQKSGAVDTLDRDVSQRSLPGLEGRLDLMIAAAGVENVAVQLSADDEAPLQRVIDVMSCLVGKQVHQLSFVEKK